MMDKLQSVAVIIPTYKPNDTFRSLLKRLQAQKRRPDRILIINTDEELFRQELIEDWDRVSVLHIGREDFDHGGTRDMAARMCREDVLVFMTQDALPADRELIGSLLSGFRDEQTAAVYARQLPGTGASDEEKYIRHFSYGEESRTKTMKDLPEMGIRTFFCSDVCAAYRRDLFLELGGFEKPAIFNEDMIFAAGAIMAGYAVRYEAGARVFHSHNYSGIQQLRRNFDLGVSQARHPEIFSRASSEKSGIQMVSGAAKYMAGRGHFAQIPVLIWHSGCKFLGYRLGKAYRLLPKAVVKAVTMNRPYWERSSKGRS